MFDVMMIEPHYPILSQNWNISANIPWMNDYTTITNWNITSFRVTLDLQET